MLDVYKYRGLVLSVCSLVSLGEPPPPKSHAVRTGLTLIMQQRTMTS